jgi:hypothetical protein
MRAAVSCALALLTAGALFLASSAFADPTSNAQGDVVRPKPSSFAPHPGSQNRVYGTPIQSRVLKSHAKKKPHLTSAPLPGS